MKHFRANILTDLSPECLQRNSPVRTCSLLVSFVHYSFYFLVHTLVVAAASSAFIEQRRRSLKRFMVLIVRHPILAKDELIKFFLTAGGQVKWEESHQVHWYAVFFIGCRISPERKIQTSRRVLVQPTC